LGALIDGLNELKRAALATGDRRQKAQPQANLMGRQQARHLDDPAAVQLEILMVGSRVAARLDRCRGPRAVHLLRDLG
jgi:hypothetical protein